MSTYESIADLYDKVDWEGGLTSAVFDYGILAEDLPEDTPEKIWRAWEALQSQADNVRAIESWLNDHSDDGREYDD